MTSFALTSVAGFQFLVYFTVFRVLVVSTRKTRPLSPNNKYCTMQRQYFEKKDVSRNSKLFLLFCCCSYWIRWYTMIYYDASRESFKKVRKNIRKFATTALMCLVSFSCKNGFSVYFILKFISAHFIINQSKKEKNLNSLQDHE